MLSAGARVGDYEIEALLGSGGMATVYRARHAFLGSRWAIKVLDPRFRADPTVRRRFLDEARIQHTHLDHPNIVKVANIVSTEEHAALVMELIEGGNLEDELPRLRGRPDEVQRLMLAILDGVEHAHAAGIIHRDLKPANVLLQRNGELAIPKLTDFGIAKVSAELAAPGKKSTHGDSRMGTIHYMSPEQIKRARDVTPRSDVFSLGAMLYEMATGVVAFGGNSDYEVMDDIVNGRFRHPTELDPSIDARLALVITTALDPEPARRFASCRDMADALRGGGQPSRTPPPRASSPMPVAHPPESPADTRPGQGDDMAWRAMTAQYGSAPPPSPAAVAQPQSQSAPSRRASSINGARAFAMLLFATLILVGTFTWRWVKVPGDVDAGVGLRGVEVCRDECKSLSWGEYERGADAELPKEIPAFGWVALVGGVAAAALGVASAFSSDGGRGLHGIVGFAGGVGLIAMALFLYRIKSYEPFEELDVSYSGIVAIIGCIGVLAARGKEA